MIMENSGLEGVQGTFAVLDPALKKLGFYPAWDYHKASYDLKLEERGHNPDYYLRIPCKVLSGIMEQPTCLLEMQQPIYFKHYYPRGIDFEAEIPPNLQKRAEDAIAKFKQNLQIQSA